MDVNAAVPRTNETEGLSVVSSLSEVSQQIAIAEEIPTEHENSHPSVFSSSDQVSTEEVSGHQRCEVQVVKVANIGGGVNITFSTPGLATLARVGDENEGATTIQVSDAQLTPIQEVAIDQSPGEAANSETSNLQGEQVIHDLQDGEMQGSPLHMDSDQDRSERQKSSSWDAVMNAEVLTVRCRNETAELHKSKLGSGGRGKCIKYQEEWMTPSEFEARCGRASSKDWKRSIRYGGRTLQTLIEEAVLTPHATSCTCASCCNDDTLAGPVRLFVPYKRRKRVSSQSGLGSPVLKKSMSLSSDPSKQERHSMMMRSVSVDSGGGTYVTEAGTVIDSGDLQSSSSVTSGATGTPVAHLPIIKDIGSSLVTVSAGSSMQPQTPLTPMAPLTPMTPIMVTSGLHFGTVNSMTTQAGQINVNLSSDPTLEHKRHWWHIEEMVNSLLSTASQLKCMIEQVRVQSEAAREAAVAQARLQAETEKKEVLAQTRMNSLLQLSKAINDAQAEREAAIAQTLLHAKADKLEAVAEARQEQLIKTLSNTSPTADNQMMQCQENQEMTEDKNGME
ncbi:deformed epidermal autoregulatory factor 1 homolog [Actinia tenebrosa]|uniref:Deformed epidermal autoregulatory factor 1 homolog n=1 Tax=Actinia tenebrosa TaxID=6105 RepID=A0A6P8IU06_ACTTE|nr:deformed epidermal autoregulatory factor 1 homolog [Actinia tenebrosa]